MQHIDYSTSTTYLEEKARDIILLTFHHFGPRLHRHYRTRAVAHIPRFYLALYPFTADFLSSTDFSFFAILAGTNAAGDENKYARLLRLDAEGRVPFELVDRVPTLTVADVFALAPELERMGWGACVKAVLQLLKVQSLEEWKGEREELVSVAARRVFGWA
ncbi:hypothetical protein FN846DRAFT_886853 [Sphaerosporella brunnea]|uniref:Uncharacterized protein n=1 Tax=Sphaerosporella brunnea TaxID=1250544 RepID=A0A5J5F8L4_9PEZI|nr:hypothetical protein FN846DRAFT_886853 [Sphaerosporella brunnea]